MSEADQRAGEITIVFTSRATAPMDEAALTALLTTACERNERARVTGMLLYAYGSFVAQLEGEPEAVDPIFTSIERDPRHHNLRLLSRRPIQRRRYGDWAMGFEHPDAAALASRLSGYRCATAHPLVDSSLIPNGDVAENLLAFMASASPGRSPGPTV
jgi:hypothetical protein